MSAPLDTAVCYSQQHVAAVAASFLPCNPYQLAQNMLLLLLLDVIAALSTLRVVQLGNPAGTQPGSFPGNKNRPGTNLQTPGVSLLPAQSVYISHIPW
jgi:hypothetical protein